MSRRDRERKRERETIDPLRERGPSRTSNHQGNYNNKKSNSKSNNQGNSKNKKSINQGNKKNNKNNKNNKKKKNKSNKSISFLCTCAMNILYGGVVVKNPKKVIAS